MSSDAAEGSSKPRISDVFSSAYRATKQLESSTQPLINAAEHKVKPEQECIRRADVQREASRRGQRQNKSISAAHPAIYLNTHSHKLLRRAIRIWKMPVPMLNGTGSQKPKPRNFQEQLKQVEMLRTRSGDSGTRTRSGDSGARTRSVRDLQLGSGTDSCPSSSSSSEKSTSRRFREQLRWYRMLSRRGKRHRPREVSHMSHVSIFTGSRRVSVHFEMRECLSVSLDQVFFKGPLRGHGDGKMYVFE